VGLIASGSLNRRLNKLNVWQRLGVILSCAWIFISLYLDSKLYDRLWWDRLYAARRYCELANPGETDKCGPFRPEGFVAPSIFQFTFVLTAVAPIIGGLIAMRVALYVARWILAGRENSN
jgi:hypothetical protein